MIYDTLEHIDAYRGVHPGVIRALELLRDTDFSQWEDGRHDIDGDIWFYRGPVSYVPLSGRRFVALWPGDAHAPCVAADGKSVPCRKCVVKVLVDWEG